MLPPLFHTFHPVPLSDGCRVLFSMATKICYSKVLSASFLHVLVLSLCHAAIVFVHFVVRRSFVLSFSLHIRPCSLLPILPFFFACCCCFFCASPFSFCFPCFSLLFVRVLCLFFCCFFGVLLLFFLCLALFVLLSVLLAVICARPLPFFLLLSALLFNNHKKPAICSTAPRTAWT